MIKFALNSNFKLVELRWSMKDDATNDKRLLRACLSELKRTQNESIGINFIVNKLI